MTNQSSTVTPEFESLKDAAARTGFHVATLRSKVASGALPAFRMTPRPGGRVRVRRVDVDALMTPVIPESVYADRS